MGISFRKLKASEIDVRVATVKENGVSLLLYKDARVDQNILDETFGIFGWQRSHQEIGGRLYCTVSVKDPDTGEWISKQDVGTESYTEKEKGQASDSFKRIPSNNVQIKNQNGTYKTYDRFSVKTIGYDENGNINKLEILNESMVKLAYSMDERPVEERREEKADPKKAKLPKERVDALRDLCKANNNMPEERIYKLYGKKSLEDMTIADREDFTKKWEQVTGEWINESKA